MPAPVIQFKRGAFANLPGLRAGEPGFTTDSYDLYVGLTSSTGTNKFFGSSRYWTRETTTVGSAVKVVEGSNNGSNFIALKSPDSLTQDYTYTLPSSYGTSGFVLQSDGAGGLTWVSASAAAGSIFGITVREEGAIVGSAGSVTSINFVGEGYTATAAGVGATITLNDATTSSKGIASFNATDFNVNSGVVGINTESIQDMIGSAINAGIDTNITIFYDDANNRINANVNTASTTTLGVASFNSSFFSVNTGAVSIATNAIGLGTHTYGQYAKSIVGGNGLTATAANPDDGTDYTIDVNTGSGITITSDAVAFKNAASLTGNTLMKWDAGNTQLTNSIITDNTTTAFVGGTLNVQGQLIPSQDNTYDVGISTLNWRNAHFSGIGTFETGAVIDGVQIGINGANVIDTVSGNLTLNSAGGVTIIDDAVTIQNNLTVNGNVTVGGTTVTLRGQDVFIENKDLVLGYTTTVSPNDDTANHAGVAIASTVGTPLANFNASGINTLPSTYKQLMWFKSGTLGFSTDAFAFNYGVAIGTTNMANGVRLAVGTGITMSDTAISASTVTATTGNFTNLSGNLTGTISTATRANTVLVTEDDTNTGSLLFAVGTGVTSVLSDNEFTYNALSNILSVPNLSVSNNVNVTGFATFGQTITGTISTATNANNINISATTSTDTTTSIVLVGNQATGNQTPFIDSGLSYNANTDSLTITGDLNVNGGDVNTTSTTASIFNANATTVNAFQAATNVVVGATSGVTTVRNSLRITNNLLDSTNSSGTSGQFLVVTGTGIGWTTISGVVPGSGIATAARANTVDILDTDAVTARVLFGTNGNGQAIYSDDTFTYNSATDSLIVSNAQHSAVKALDGTNAITISNTTGNVGIASDLTVTGNLYVAGNTTQVNTTSLQIEDRVIELGRVQGTAPSDTTWDLGILFNYYTASSNKKASVYWEHGAQRFLFASDVTESVLGINLPDSGAVGLGTTTPQLTAPTFAPIEVGALWVNDTAGSSAVVSYLPLNGLYTGSPADRYLHNVTVDGGTF